LRLYDSCGISEFHLINKDSDSDILFSKNKKVGLVQAVKN